MNPVDPRQIGPVTTAAGTAAAASGIITWLVETFAHITVPTDVQTYLAIVLVVAAGWLVKPRPGSPADTGGNSTAPDAAGRHAAGPASEIITGPAAGPAPAVTPAGPVIV